MWLWYIIKECLVLSAHKPPFYQKTSMWKRSVLQNQGYLDFKKCLGSLISALLFKPKRWVKVKKLSLTPCPRRTARKQTVETGTNTMGSYLWEEEENSMISAGPPAVTPWFCWRRSADSPGSSCCVGQKQGPIPRQYFCLLPSYLQHRQQAWFSTSLLPFLPLSCGRSCLSLAPCPPVSNFQCCRCSWEPGGGSAPVPHGRRWVAPDAGDSQPHTVLRQCTAKVWPCLSSEFSGKSQMLLLN